MPVIVIVGAGSGLGLSLARQFGERGFTVGLVARSREKLDQLTGVLAAQGITARGYPADVTDPAGLRAALDAARADLGPVDVLEYSPAPTPGAALLGPVDAVDLTIEAVRPQLEYYLFGGITAVQAVLPEMLKRGQGTILVSTGASSGPVTHPPFGNIAAASAALRNWILNLHAAVAPQGIYAAHIAIAAWIGKGGPKSDPDVIADAYWDLYQQRTQPELFYLDETMNS
jgi:NAD(P)-dependent dehydrogenase (short-subunit alcohol dehydrogenase family)